MRRRIQTAVVILAWLAYARLAWVVLAAHVTGGARRHHVEAAWFLLASIAVVAALLARSDRVGDTAAAGGPGKPGDGPGKPGPYAVPLFVALAFVLYRPALGVGLLSDDFVLLAKPLFGAWEFVRPVPMLLWKAVYPLGGPAALHVVNVTLHALNAGLVWIFARQIGCGAPGRWIAAFFFLTFPAAVEPVTWSAGIFDVLLATLTLAAALLAHRPQRSSRVAALLLVVAALFTKETAVVLPVLLALAASASRRRPFEWTTVAAAGCVAGYVAFRIVAMPGSPAPFAPLDGYVVKELAGRPFASLVLPWTRAELLRHPIALAVVPQLAAGALIVRYAVRHNASRLLPLFLWILVSVLPLLGYLYVGDSLEGSRYLYVPLAAWAVVIARLIEVPAAAAPRLSHAAIAVVIALHAIGVRAHIRPWKDAASLRDRIVAAARAAHDASGCSTSSFDGVPHSVEGAHLFRNGFAEAVVKPIDENATADCAFTWTGDRFLPRERRN